MAGASPLAKPGRSPSLGSGGIGTVISRGRILCRSTVTELMGMIMTAGPFGFGSTPLPVGVQPPQTIVLGPDGRIEAAVLGPIGRRILAWFVDGAAATAVTFIGFVVATIIAFRPDSDATVFGIAFAIIGVYFLALVVVEGLTGRTIGKSMLGLRTVHESSLRAPGIPRAFLRAIVLVPTIIGLWAIVLLVSTLVLDRSFRGQGWHDRVAKTLVIDVRRGADTTRSRGAFAPPVRAL